MKLGHVAIDGSKLRANASKHKAMSYERMCEKEQQLTAEVARLLGEAQAADEAEDKQHGKGHRGDELPAELARRESRLRKIREAKAALEEEARQRAGVAATEAQAKIEDRKKRAEETGKQTPGPMPQVVNVAEAKPDPKAQRNFTDPESRIMKDSATGSFEQSYNAQIAVDGTAQIIVAASLTQAANDKQQLVPVLEEVKNNVGRLPEKVTADAGYFSTTAVTNEALSGIDLYVTPDRGKKTEQVEESSSEQEPAAAGVAKAVTEYMREKLKTDEGRDVYKQRKMIVEPVFGQVKEVRGFRRFSFRGLRKNEAEWQLVCLTHNLLKLFRARPCGSRLKNDQGAGCFLNQNAAVSLQAKLCILRGRTLAVFNQGSN
jgi:hypothetical protein